MKHYHHYLSYSITDKMQRFTQKWRFYCTLFPEVNKNQQLSHIKDQQLNFKQLNHPSKVPLEPVKQSFHVHEKPAIDSATIQLLERLALVNLESKEALKTLESSIEFAEQITNIDTTDVPPLYTVLENTNLYLREDQVTEGDCREEVLRGAKVTEEDYFVSPPGNIPLQQKEKDFSSV